MNGVGCTNSTSKVGYAHPYSSYKIKLLKLVSTTRANRCNYIFAFISICS